MAGRCTARTGLGKAAGQAHTGAMADRFSSFAEFYVFYLGEHARRATRRLHFAGSSLGLVCLVLLVLTGDWWWLPVGLACGYGCAWFAHIACEKNRPATFRHPLYSFMGDWVMFWQILTGKIAF